MGKYMAVKKRIYEIIEASRDGDMTSKAYDIMILTAMASGLIPLMIKGENPYTRAIDVVTVIIFLIDYLLRVYTSDYKMGVISYKAYLGYMITPMAIIDFCSVIPILSLIFPQSITLGLFRIFRIFRILKVLRYSPVMRTIGNVLQKVRKPLTAVFILTFMYIYACALIMFQVEPEIFGSFIDAFYWSGCTVLSVGYGDITPLSQVGRVITVVSATVGMAVIALPSGIVTAAYMDEITRKKGKYQR